VVHPNLSEARGRVLALAHIAARGERRSKDVALFLLDLDRHAASLSSELCSRTYRPSQGRLFRIRDPKPREIYALPFRDRVAQHFLMEATLARIERSLAPQSYACRAGMGTHRCLQRAAELFRRRAFVLHIDIRRFFASIDHALLRALLDPMTPSDLRWLRDAFLDQPVPVERAMFHFPGDDLFTPATRPHGLPIGSLTSQIWANAFLTPIDHLLSSYLGIGTFVRYCDDILVFHEDIGRLRTVLEHIGQRATLLRLRLHEGKTRIYRTTDPVPFLGFVLRRRERGLSIRLRGDNIRRMRGRISLQAALFEAGAIDVEDLRSSLVSWIAHASHGHTRAVVQRELSRLSLRCRIEENRDAGEEPRD